MFHELALAAFLEVNFQIEKAVFQRRAYRTRSKFLDYVQPVIKQIRMEFSSN